MARYQGSLTPPYTFQDFRTADGRFDINAELEAEKQWLEQVKADLRSKAKGDLVGEEVQFPRGDGYARYLIAKQRPFTLVHLDVGDAWHADGATIRGFRLQDARARVEADRRWKAREEAELRQREEFFSNLAVGAIVHVHNSFGQFVRCEVVAAAEDQENSYGQGFKKGDHVLKPVALVGPWKKWDLSPDSYHAQRIKNGDVYRPRLENVYEAFGVSKDMRRHADPRPMEAHVIEFQQELFAS